MAELIIPNRIYQPEFECMDRAERRALQLKRLKESIERASVLDFYKKKFKELGITADKINSLDDLRRLPITTKQDLRDYYPFGFFAVDRSKLVRIHASSGTTGKPTFVGYTKNDLDLWSTCCARFLVAGGLTPDQVTQIAFGYGLFTGGFGLHYGIEKVGAAIIPASSGNTQRQIMLLKDAKVDTVICTPSYALNIAEVIKAQGLKKGDLAWKFAHFGGEQWTEEMRLKIEDALGIYAFNNYGLSEIIGPGVSGECAARTGMHIQEDHFLVECLNPETLEPVAEGEEGELVITALSKEACPIIRYRTRDLSKLFWSEPCPCGRTTMRMSRVKGRTDDMMIIRGVNVFPSQVEEALMKVGGIAPHYLIELYRPGNLDQAVVKIEMLPETFSDKMDELQKLKNSIDREISAITGIHFDIQLVAPNSLERTGGKAKHVADYRGLKID
ncbi:MAG: phenylacetate--CoA ligase [Lentisphaeria bacterium]|nr:phenylacetate--CoA ligase [Lentisphaeria bacterium]